MKLLQTVEVKSVVSFYSVCMLLVDLFVHLLVAPNAFNQLAAKTLFSHLLSVLN